MRSVGNHRCDLSQQVCEHVVRDHLLASPDQDGVTKSASRTTTLFLVKDSECDVHLAPYHYWSDARVAQPSLLEPRAVESAPSEAVCVVAGTDAE